MTHNPKQLLILMAKQPLVGQSKTRLMPRLSAPQAADLAHCFLVDKLSQMRQVAGVDLAIAYAPDTSRAFFADLAPDFRLWPQVGPDLAARLRNIFAQTLAEGYEAVVAIDGDTVTLPPAHLEATFAALGAADVSLGPCEDGGYYAIGMKKLYPSLFDVQMSTPQVLSDTLHQAKKAALSVQLLPLWYDVDTPADLYRLAKDLASSQTATAHYLRQLALPIAVES
jgi:rSAM/selenodomain-associated transferase 1